MVFSVKIVNGWNPLSIFAKSSISDVQVCPEYTFKFSCKQSLFWRETDIPNTKQNESIIEHLQFF